METACARRHHHWLERAAKAGDAQTHCSVVSHTHTETQRTTYQTYTTIPTHTCTEAHGRPRIPHILCMHQERQPSDLPCRVRKEKKQKKKEGVTRRFSALLFRLLLSSSLSRGSFYRPGRRAPAKKKLLLSGVRGSPPMHLPWLRSGKLAVATAARSGARASSRQFSSPTLLRVAGSVSREIRHVAMREGLLVPVGARVTKRKER